ncbi:hypothetical protein ASF10_08855 [Flavobacterium sp. Leaf82]|uniref:hypothetical protein n=1 Tax=unclassified Flavobacterium TaxID=196869 RepID=UPI0006FD379B|nr:hypothetical protein [Flavobacterium sp. Leaf82]KQO22476.1 hypothetical protein ASF10_08855 [Flavobacterium sp. Leaf82]
MNIVEEELSCKETNVKTNLNFEHTTCKNNLIIGNNLKKLINSKFAIYSIILLLIYLLAFISFNKSWFFDFSMFSFCIAGFCWIVFYMNSQQMINKNQFKQFALLGLLIIFLSTILLITTKSNFFDFIVTVFPLFYVLYFRVLLFLFYKDFHNSYKKPTLLFASKGSKWRHENQDYTYIISTKEIILSNLLFFGPFLFAGLVFVVIVIR